MTDDDRLPGAIQGFIPLDLLDRNFHLREGLFFQGSDPNLEPGCVRITVAENDGKILRQVVVTASEWASAIASVSARGENGETHAEAERFHLESRADRRESK
jgi:hypothetical protein